MVSVKLPEPETVIVPALSIIQLAESPAIPLYTGTGTVVTVVEVVVAAEVVDTAVVVTGASTETKGIPFSSAYFSATEPLTPLIDSSS